MMGRPHLFLDQELCILDLCFETKEEVPNVALMVSKEGPNLARVVQAMFIRAELQRGGGVWVGGSPAEWVVRWV